MALGGLSIGQLTLVLYGHTLYSIVYLVHTHCALYPHVRTATLHNAAHVTLCPCVLVERITGTGNAPL